MIKNLHLYISLFFLSRYYITKDIIYILKKYHLKGSIIDIGCGSKPYEPIFKKYSNITQYNGIDFPSYSINKDFTSSKPDYTFTKEYTASLQLPFPNKKFSNSVAFQVLEHHPQAEKLSKEMVRITKKKGKIIITAPFIWALHELPHDYFRFTEYGLRELFEKNNCKIIKITKQGSLFSVISMLLNEELNNFASKGKLYYVISIIIYAPFLLYQYCCLILDQLYKSKYVHLNYLVSAEKK